MDKAERAARLARSRYRAMVAILRRELEAWIERRNGEPSDLRTDDRLPKHYVETSAALLEIAVDRYLRLHGEDETRAIVLTALDRQAATYRNGLQ